MIKEELGQEIRRLRTSQSYSQEDFAKLSGIDRTYISDVEQGKRNVSIDNIEKIAKALNVTLPELFSFNRPIQKTIILTVNGEEFILESNKELTRDIKDHIEAIADYFYDEERKSDKGIFLYMISSIVLTPMIFLIPDKYHLEFANLFSPNIYMYLILLTSLVFFVMNIYNFKQITTYTKNKLLTFIFLQSLVYIEYFYLVYFFTKLKGKK